MNAKQESNAEYYQTHKEERSEYHKLYYHKNIKTMKEQQAKLRKEKSKARYKLYRLKNPDRVKEVQRIYRKTHPDKIREQNRKRYAKFKLKHIYIKKVVPIEELDIFGGDCGRVIIDMEGRGDEQCMACKEKTIDNYFRCFYNASIKDWNGWRIK